MINFDTNVLVFKLHEEDNALALVAVVLNACYIVNLYTAIFLKFIYSSCLRILTGSENILNLKN